MKLVPRRQQTKKDQALDLVASAAKTWSEWQLAKQGTKAVAKTAKRAAKAGAVARVAPVGKLGALAVVGGVGVGALVAKKKLAGRGQGAAPAYSPPVQPPAPMNSPAPPAATPGAPSPPV